MTDRKIENLRKEYENIPIPDELDFVVIKALKQEAGYPMKKEKNHKKLYTALTAVAASALFITGVNTNQSFAATVSNIPVIGSLAKVVTFTEFNVNEEQSKANIKVPSVSGLKNKKLENELNEKYLTEGKALFENFKKETKYANKIGGAHLGIKSGYEVKTDNEQILSIKRYEVSTSNGYSATQFDTIDKQHEILITLPSLFKNDHYIDIISENIKTQMIERYEEDKENNYYWVEGIPNDIEAAGLFQKINKNQNFYINNNGKLVIYFDKYEVAPGAYGESEFVIPTNVLSNVLVSDAYIK
ncbi:Anti-sigma-V factor RsiV [Peribacillus sp. Bi96]|uniref:DUF3298 and DUF4163 domain-containing protein n=1 Tax=unclassified Peribacillus TaxID=2675266 RepID=UPI001D661438|nr:DUF3298 and DUF4163 domain-containing protein [Peribacillus sp. Bi96]CAH0314243.1 Anti-sigma-V factor RsiV [Peribacillus sp. Bi96]